MSDHKAKFDALNEAISALRRARVNHQLAERELFEAFEQYRRAEDAIDNIIYHEKRA